MIPVPRRVSHHGVPPTTSAWVPTRTRAGLRTDCIITAGDASNLEQQLPRPPRRALGSRLWPLRARNVRGAPEGACNAHELHFSGGGIPTPSAATADLRLHPVLSDVNFFYGSTFAISCFSPQETSNVRGGTDIPEHQCFSHRRQQRRTSQIFPTGRSVALLTPHLPSVLLCSS